jgi:thiol-disulfide isomerase/thioredoxin
MKIAKILPALLMVAALSVAGCVSGISGEKTLEDGTIVKADGTMIKPDGTMIAPDGTMTTPDGTMTKPDGTMVKPDGTMILPNGTIIPPEAMMEKTETSGLTKFANNYYRYDPDAYQKALDDGKVIFLDFHADWCPICVAEKPSILAAFNELNADDVIGFQVHYNDGQTKSFDTDLIKQFQVAYQHTKIIIGKDGEISTPKTLEQFNKERVLSEINKARNA